MGGQRGGGSDPPFDLDARQPLNDDIQLVARHFYRLENFDDRAVQKQFARVRVFVLGVLLSDDAQQFVAGQRTFDRFERVSVRESFWFYIIGPNRTVD